MNYDQIDTQIRKANRNAVQYMETAVTLSDIEYTPSIAKFVALAVEAALEADRLLAEVEASIVRIPVDLPSEIKWLVEKAKDVTADMGDGYEFWKSFKGTLPRRMVQSIIRWAGKSEYVGGFSGSTFYVNMDNLGYETMTINFGQYVSSQNTVRMEYSKLKYGEL